MALKGMAQVAPPSPATILVVENHAIVRMELAAQLADLGLRALAACDADAAVHLLHGHPEITLLLTCVSMPGSMDGVSLAHEVSERWPSIQIIVMSGRPSAVDELPSGSGFILKPYAPEHLCDALAPLIMEKSRLGRSAVGVT